MNALPLLRQVVSQTPSFVWIILALCVVMGVMQSRDQRPKLSRIRLTPVLWAFFAFAGVVSTFGGDPAVIVAWLLGLGLSVAAFGRSAAPEGALFDSATGRFFVPGSWQPMIIIMSIFAVKYLVGASLAMAPQLAQQSKFSMVISALYGMLGGLFVARACRLLQLSASNRAELGARPAA